ncbi:uncharacterized protein LOC109950815 [Prunus persica]|uniref:uncharacterized protein LOC109950815 n=1 Tax=Prunus persica TaxID=3760 RepID=UPI0009AB6449|nr:uncharacterized protein LOC109950815 [Prunus persica]
MICGRQAFIGACVACLSHRGETGAIEGGEPIDDGGGEPEALSDDDDLKKSGEECSGIVVFEGVEGIAIVSSEMDSWAWGSEKSPHPSSECTTGNPFASLEQINQVAEFNRHRNDPYSNMYNPGWRNHPNFSRSNTQNVQRPPPGFLAQEKKINLEDAVTQLTMSTTQFMTEIKTQFQNQSVSIRNLEMQVGHLANVLSGRNQGVLPSQPVINPKNQETSNGNTIREKKQVNTAVDLEKEKLEKEKEAEKSQEEENYAVMLTPSPPLKPYVQPIPFPLTLKKNKIDEQSSNFLETFKKVQINIPFASALEKMPSFEKFMKHILSKKRKFGDHEKIQLTEECSAILQ